MQVYPGYVYPISVNKNTATLPAGPYRIPTGDGNRFVPSQNRTPGFGSYPDGSVPSSRGVFPGASGYISGAYDMMGRNLGRVGRVVGKTIGTFMPESTYIKLNEMSNKLINKYDINKFLPPNLTINQSINNLLDQLKLFDKMMNSVYKSRLTYLKQKYENQKKYNDPESPETEKKIEETQNIIFSVEQIISSIRNALTVNLHGEGLLVNYDRDKQMKYASSSSPGGIYYLDAFTLSMIFEGIGNIIAALAGAMGGKTKRRRHKAKKTKRSKRRKTSRRR